MKAKIGKTLGAFVLFFIFLSPSVNAAPSRVGLAIYEVASGENVDYLKKVAKESLGASLQARGYSIVDLSFTEDEIKKRGLAATLKKENLDAILAGSIVKVGNTIQIFSRVYTSASLSQPVILTSTASSMDGLLGALGNHSQLIVTELSKTSVPALAAIPVENKTPPPVKTVSLPTPAISTPEPKPVKVKTPKLKEAEPLAHSKEQIRETFSNPASPDYTWVSNIQPFEARGVAYGDVNGDGQKEIVLIDLKHVYVYEFTRNQIRLLKDYEGSSNDQFVRVYTHDVNGDGKEEILVSNVNRGQAASLALELNGDQFKEVAQNSPWLIKVLRWKGENIILGETFTGMKVDYHDIHQLKVENGRFKDVGKFEAPSEIGLYGLQAFKQVSSDPEQILYLTPSGYLKIFDPDGKEKFKKKWSSSDKYGGTSNFIRLNQTNMFNEVEGQFTYFNVEPISWTGSDGHGSIIVPKNDDFLKNIIGTRPVVKNTWFTKLHWEDIGMRETFSTRKIDGYFADNIKVQLPWESQPKLLALLWVRDKGFMNAMGTFKTVVALYDL